VCSADPFELDVALEQAHGYGATTSKCGALESVFVSSNPSPDAQDDRTLADLSYAASQFLLIRSATSFAVLMPFVARNNFAALKNVPRPGLRLAPSPVSRRQTDRARP